MNIEYRIADLERRVRELEQRIGAPVGMPQPPCVMHEWKSEMEWVNGAMMYVTRCRKCGKPMVETITTYGPTLTASWPSDTWQS